MQKSRTLVGEAVKFLRKDLNLTQAAFAKRLGVTEGYICNIETGDNGLSVAFADKIARLAKPKARKAEHIHFMRVWLYIQIEDDIVKHFKRKISR
jgi:transcriptional regulator with XRE-family HTH domain